MQTNTTTAREISDRRLALLVSLGENARNTAAWRDACAEAAWLGRREAFAAWRADGGQTFYSRCK